MHRHPLADCWVEPVLADARPGAPVQFEREGYLVLDSGAAASGRLVFNRTVTPWDSWERG